MRWAQIRSRWVFWVDVARGVSVREIYDKSVENERKKATKEKHTHVPHAVTAAGPRR